jgi:uncharacterized protein (TIGR03435 family)
MTFRVAAIGLTLAFGLEAQTPAFDVASLKPVQITGDLYTANLGRAQHGEVTLTNATLADCIRYAYGISNDAQIAGPEWIRSKDVRFDIVGKTSPATSQEQMLRMLQTLLTERFQMAVHREPREIGYLSLSRGKNGAKMATAQEGANAARQPQIPGRIISPRMTMSTLVTLLSRFLRQTVLDQTGLEGAYDIHLTWTPENRRDEEAGPTIYTAVQEQLGLKLESRKGPLEVLVIDRAERVPLEN